MTQSFSLCLRANKARAEGRYADAEDIARDAIALNERNGLAWFQLGGVLLAQGKAEAAHEAAERAELVISVYDRRDFDIFDHQELRAEAMFLAGQKERSVVEYERLFLWPRYRRELWLLQGHLAAGRGDLDAAREAYAKAIEKSDYAQRHQMARRALETMAGAEQGEMELEREAPKPAADSTGERHSDQPAGEGRGR